MLDQVSTLSKREDLFHLLADVSDLPVLTLTLDSSFLDLVDSDNTHLRLSPVIQFLFSSLSLYIRQPGDINIYCAVVVFGIFSFDLVTMSTGGTYANGGSGP